MPEFHPDGHLLIEFATGSLHRAKAICVSAHLSYCPVCAARVRSLGDVGGVLLGQQCSAVSGGLLAATLARLSDRSAPSGADSGQNISQEDDVLSELEELPALVRQLLGATPGWQWRRQSPSLRTIRLKTGQNDYEVALQRICAGGSTPYHDHKGEEYTVVLKGSFCDEDGLYRPGDFLLRGPGDRHRPRGLQHEECICLSALSDSIDIKTPLGWLLTPWLRIHPM